jgi:hypothetical protein
MRRVAKVIFGVAVAGMAVFALLMFIGWRDMGRRTWRQYSCTACFRNEPARCGQNDADPQGPSTSEENARGEAERAACQVRYGGNQEALSSCSYDLKRAEKDMMDVRCTSRMVTDVESGCWGLPVK